MLPSNAPSAFPLPGRFLSPDDRVTGDLIDHERGGIGLNDASLGRDVQEWSCWYDGVEVIAAPDGGQQYQLFTHAGIEQLSFTFDQNMRPLVVFIAAGETKLWWYDPMASAYVSTSFGTSFKSPRLAMDDKRAMATSTSDVIFAYIRYDSGSSSHALCYRQQRDRYQTERVLRTGLSSRTRLKNIGMSSNLRFQFELV